MPSEKTPFYDPVPPTYDEALASTSRRDGDWRNSRFPIDNRNATETESRSLLAHPTTVPGSSRRPRDYIPPTAETDDDDSLWGSDSDDESSEAAQIRQEMQEMEVEEPDRVRGSIWGKAIGFSGFTLSLPRWKWSWRPRLPRLRIQLPQRAPESTDETTNENQPESDTETSPRRWEWPKISSVTILLTFARLLALFIILGFFYFLFTSGFFGGLSSQMGAGYRFNPEDLRLHLQNSVDPQRLRASVKHYSSYAHIAGTQGDYATALDMKAMFERAGLDEVTVDEYFVYVNYPLKDGRAVQILDRDAKKATWSAKLEEKDVGEETAGHQTYSFHGHSKSGDVRGPLIYANYGSREDFQSLKDEGVDTKGAIALVKYYGTPENPALKVKAAELAGFAGCIIYSDPADDGFLKGKVAPHGRYMPADGVQRGSVSLTSWVVGDVLTPGWESKKDVPRMDPDDVAGLAKIPSLPLSWVDAQVLLQGLKGHGKKVPDSWRGGVPDVGEWWTGDGASPIVRLKNEQDESKQQSIWNVYGKIIGTEQTAKSIILGNHRDAWAFGSTDPHAGTAIMIEVARILGDLVDRGWRPLRTIEFMSWDAEEYNLVGSTEFVENNLESLRENAFVYINLDEVVQGNELHASGSPLLEKALVRALGRVGDPYLNATLKELWHQRHGEIEGLGARSDYVAFQDIAGISSLDLQFKGERYPRHSSYDNFKLVEQVIDPGFVYHGLMTQVVGLLMLELSDRAIMPFDTVTYAQRLKKWVEDLEHWSVEQTRKGKTKDDAALSFLELKDAAEQIKLKAESFEKWEQRWDHLIRSSGGWEATDMEEARMSYNNKMAWFETALLDLELGGGIPNRTQFKHVVFGPQLWSEDDNAYFPAIRDSIDAKDWSLARRTIAKTAVILRQAASVLEM